jgi:hypothetical protein
MSGCLDQEWGLRLRTCDIWVCAEPKGTAIVRCGVQAVSRYVVRYRGKVEEVQHILSDFTARRLVSFAVPRWTTIWAETRNTRGEVDLGHRGRGLDSQMSKA